MARGNPGYHSIDVGAFTVTAINDGQFTASTELLQGPTTAESEALLREGFRPVPPRILVSCFMVERDGHRAVVDFGGGGVFGDALGRAPARLKAMEVAPDSVQTVLLTHGHGDHVGGLVDAQGGSVFPNAELVVNEAEAAFWTDGPQTDNGAPARRALQAYGNRVRKVRDGETVLPGIKLHALPGHTPGHSGYMIESDGHALLIWGDTVNLPGILLARPDARLTFDTDVEQGRQTRQRTLDMAATDRLLIAGNHLDFPLFGHLERRGSGYGFIPLVWTPTSDQALG